MAEDWEGFPERECDRHRTVGPHRAWCSVDQEWCYPQAPCRGCELPRLRKVVEAARGVMDAGGRTAKDVAYEVLGNALAALDAEP